MKRKKAKELKDYNFYHPDEIPLFEAIYGENLISLGSLASIDNMFSDLDIQGLKALDLGFGLGGVAFYLAKQYKMKITGIEINPWMVQYANEHIPVELSDFLAFNTYTNAGELPYKPDTFDLVYSKGVLNHIADKANLFKQIHAVLKTNGLLVIADWLSPRETIDESMSLVYETKEAYEEVLRHAGFIDISFRDDSQLFLNYAKELLTRLADNEAFIKQQYSEELFSAIQKQHEELIDKIQQKQKIASRIVAKKVILR